MWANSTRENNMRCTNKKITDIAQPFGSIRLKEEELKYGI